MKANKSLVVHVSDISDIDKITDNTKYINIDITNYNHEIISYFINNGNNYLYSETIDGNLGYIYINYEQFVKAESIIDVIYANMPKDLNELEIARYLYIAITKFVSFDNNISEDKIELCHLSLINNINNLWGSLAIGKVNDRSASKIYYYLCRRLDIDITLVIDNNTKDVLNRLNINNQILLVDLFKDIPYIQAQMQTRFFSTYNDSLELDRKIKYIKNKYNDYYLDKSLRNIDYTREDCVQKILTTTEKILNLNIIKPTELSIIYKYLFDKYCPNYDIKINNLYLNNKNKNHFIMITYNNCHYGYNYREKNFVKINELDILKNLKSGKICLYQDELIPNINL